MYVYGKKLNWNIKNFIFGLKSQTYITLPITKFTLKPCFKLKPWFGYYISNFIFCVYGIDNLKNVVHT